MGMGEQARGEFFLRQVAQVQTGKRQYRIVMLITVKPKPLT
jgi:hypothetical protein